MGESGNEMYGGHDITIIDFDDTLGGFIFLNSWDTTWGDGGFGLLPYQCVQDMGEATVIRSFEDMEFEDDTVYAARRAIVRIYVSLLGRAPDLGGVLYWSDLLLKGNPLDVLADAILTSTEFAGKYGTAGKMVVDLTSETHYKAFLNRLVVAEYCTLDLACNVEAVYKHCLDNVTDDAATVDVAKKWIRMNAGGAAGVL